MNKKNYPNLLIASEKICALPAPELTRMEIHAKKVLEDMLEVSAVCNAAGHHWALWALLNDLMVLAGDIERKTDKQRGAAR